MTSTPAGEQQSASDKLHSGRGKTLTSRLGSLFTSKPSHINESFIDLDEPRREFGPGDTIRGTYVLDVARPLGVTHIAVSLFGYLEVLKNRSRNKTSLRNNAGRVASRKGKRWVSEYYGDGFASLFEDEVVLCGQGRLDPKLYHFRFELDFPAHLSLPSSIDFERGTVSYVVSATITRPTTMNPTTTCSRKVFFREVIDVGKLSNPRPRLVTLEPSERSSRSSRTKIVRRLTSSSAHDDRSSVYPPSSSSSHGDRSSQVTTPRNQRNTSRAPSPTSPSAGSSMSVPYSVTRESVLAEARSPRNSPSIRIDSASANGRASPRTITAQVQLSRAGCLPGELVPLTVTVNHTKSVRSIRGVVATLYRQARVDMHPNLPLVDSAGKPQKFEDYYPRSKTGLGGLSLSAAGSGQVWRKDLSQTFAPLIINPLTMSTVVKTAVRVPDNAFPTFRNAPGDMITFKYFVEVVIDIHGKLASQPGLSQDMDFMTMHASLGVLQDGSSQDDGKVSSATLWGPSCIDTASMRRDKNAVVCVNELTIGTKDSQRARGKGRATHPLDPNDIASAEASTSTAQQQLQPPGAAVNMQAALDPRSPALSSAASPLPHASAPGEWQYDEGYYGYEYGYDYDYGYDYNYNYPYEYHDPHGPPGAFGNGIAPPAADSYQYFRPPPVMDELALPEKERMRRAEERLLPSQPPGMDGAAPAMDGGPSAPYIPDENDFESAEAFRAAVASPHAQGPPPHTPDATLPLRSFPQQQNASHFLTAVPSHPVPTYSPAPLTGPPLPHPHPGASDRHEGLDAEPQPVAPAGVREAHDDDAAPATIASGTPPDEAEQG